MKRRGRIKFGSRSAAALAVALLLFSAAGPARAQSARQAAIESFETTLKALPGTVAHLLIDRGAARAAHNADRPLAVGSAFKMQILAVLAARIRDGKHKWGDVVPLRARDRSIAGSTMIFWPPDAPVTISTLATMMISVSDNTATDALLHLVGRGAVEAAGPARNRPFLTTREFFTLKAKGNEALRNRFEAGDEKTKRMILTEIAGMKRPPGGYKEYDFGPRSIEWYFTVRELCGLIGEVHALAPMRVNPGLARRAQWRSVAYKGGSEPGVLNFTHHLVRHDGSAVCLATTWNDDKPFDPKPFYTPIIELLGAISR